MKFRDEKLQFKVSETADHETLKHAYRTEYPTMVKVNQKSLSEDLKD